MDQQPQKDEKLDNKSPEHVGEPVATGQPAHPLSKLSVPGLVDNALERVQGDTDDADLRCGWFFITPVFLQSYMTARCVLFTFCVAAFVQGMVISGFVNVALPTLERRFKLQSAEVGMIVSMYNIGSLALLLPITFLGGQGHRPRLMAIGTLIMGIGSLLFSLPHFLAPQYKFSVLKKELCPFTEEDAPAEADDLHLRNYRWVLMFANMLHGLAMVPFYTLSVSFLDDNLSNRKSAKYISIYYTAAIMGPACGFILGGTFLNIYTDITVDPATLGLSRSSNVWVGAWWLGFLLTFILASLASIPIFAFPRKLPGSARIMSEKRIEVDERIKGDIALAGPAKIGDMPRALWCLLHNKTFVFICLASTLETSIGSGYANFATKLFESQFRLSSSGASLLLGMMAIPSASLGTLLGGYIISKLDMACSTIIRMCLNMCIINWFVFLMMFSYCPNLHYRGVNREAGVIESLPCSSNCSCPMEFNPVCGEDQIMYLSGCLAGCREEAILNGSHLYSSCECVNATTPSRTILLTNGSVFTVAAERMRCKSDCFAYFLYILATFLSLFMTFFISAPAVSVAIRCVLVKQKSFALGVMWACIRLLGSIPAPVIFGTAIDSACRLWSSALHNMPANSGNCLLYDNANMSRHMAGLLLFLKSLSIVCFICASLSYHPPEEHKSP
ncbi:unnamed protein product, partial [Ixodes pacificus]